MLYHSSTRSMDAAGRRRRWRPSEMSWPSSYDLDPNVVTGQLSTSALANILINYLNTSQAVIGLNPAGSYATMAAALAGKIDMAGGVAMTAALSMGSNRITNLATPTTGTDAATKAYVDAAAIGALTIHARCGWPAPPTWSSPPGV